MADPSPGGSSAGELIATPAVLERAGLIDFVDVSIGSYFRQEKFIGGMYEPAGYMLPTSLPVTRSTRLPTIVTGRITTLAEAERLLAPCDHDFLCFSRGPNTPPRDSSTNPSAPRSPRAA